ncbi:MAG: exosome complex protein Rrp42 [Candidatus Thermoplasmatota archaeon]
MKEILSNITKDYLYRLLKEGKRIDGRGLLEYRDISIEADWTESAEGSARVKLGDTDVIAGIKMEVGEPFPDTPNEGVLTTAAELIPMASPEYESGPPGEDATELARVVDRGIRESGAVDTTELCIEEGEKAWVIFIDIHVLDFDGNLFDAAGIGAMTALMDAHVPASDFDDAKEDEDYPLPIEHIVVPTTFTKIKDQIILDSQLEEEKIADARLTVTFNEEDEIVAMQKGLRGVFKYEDTMECIEKSKEKGKVMREKILDEVDRENI